MPHQTLSAIIAFGIFLVLMAVAFVFIARR
jgi:hypothetical protein